MRQIHKPAYTCCGVERIASRGQSGLQHSRHRIPLAYFTPYLPEAPPHVLIRKSSSGFGYASKFRSLSRNDLILILKMNYDYRSWNINHWKSENEFTLGRVLVICHVSSRYPPHLLTRPTPFVSWSRLCACCSTDQPPPAAAITWPGRTVLRAEPAALGAGHSAGEQVWWRLSCSVIFYIGRISCQKIWVLTTANILYHNFMVEWCGSEVFWMKCGGCILLYQFARLNRVKTCWIIRQDFKVA